MASHDDPQGLSTDISFRMSKKIAQLTKVIYQLNCRCEDNDSTLRTVADAYENEIASMMSEAKKKLESMKATIDAAGDQSKVKEVIATMTRQHQQEKTEAMRQFDEYRAKVAQQDASSKRAVEERIMAMSQDVQKAKDDFQAKLAEITGKLRREHSEALAALNDGRTQKNQEIQDLVVQYNEKYKAMLAMQLEERDQLEKEHVRKEAEWKAKVAALEAEQRRKEQEWAARSQQMEDRAKQQAQQNLDALNRVRELDAAKTAAETEALKWRTRAEALTGQLDALHAQFQDKGKAADAQSQALSELRRQIAQLEEASASLQGQVASLTDALGKKQTIITGLGNDLEIARVQIAALTKELEDERSRVQSSSTTSSALSSELAKLKSSLADTARALSDERAASRTLRTELADAIESGRRKDDALEQERQRHAKDLADAVAAHDQQLRAALHRAAETGDGALDALRSQFAEERAALKRQHEKKLSEFTDERNKTVAGLQERLSAAESGAARMLLEHSQTVAQLNARIAELNAASSSTSAELSARLDEAQAEVERLRQQLGDVTKASADRATLWATERASLQDRLNELEKFVSTLRGEASSEVKRLTQEIDTTKATAAAQADALRKDADDRCDRLRTEWQNDVLRLKSEHEQALRQLVAQAGSSASEKLDNELRKQREQLMSESQRLLAEKTDAFNAARSELEKRIKELLGLNGDLETKVRDLTDAQAATEARGKDEVDKAALAAKRREAELNESVEKMRRENAALVAAFNSERSALQSALEELKRSSADAMSATEQAQRDALKKAEDRFATSREELSRMKDDERSKALSEQQQRLSLEMQRAVDQHAKEIEEERDGRAKLDRELRIALKDKATVSADLGIVQRRLLEEQAAHQDTKRAGAAALEQASRAADEMKQNLEAKAKRHVTDLEESHRAALDAAAATLAERQAEWANKVKAFQRHIADLEYRIANRESRAEDVAKINELLKQLREKDEALIRAYQESQKYKLDLLNKESTYNKVFGRQPTIDSATAGVNPAASLIAQDQANLTAAMSMSLSGAVPPATTNSAPSTRQAAMATRPPATEAPNPRARIRSLNGVEAPSSAAASRLPDMAARR